jgi:hypothetical protein
LIWFCFCLLISLSHASDRISLRRSPLFFSPASEMMTAYSHHREITSFGSALLGPCFPASTLTFLWEVWCCGVRACRRWNCVVAAAICGSRAMRIHAIINHGRDKICFWFPNMFRFLRSRSARVCSFRNCFFFCTDSCFLILVVNYSPENYLEWLNPVIEFPCLDPIMWLNLVITSLFVLS